MTKNIWPRRLPHQVRRDRRRRAEVEVYDRFTSELTDDYHVFYSSPWLTIDRFGNEKDGECDFVVAHERLGVLAIEVKGGGINYDPATNQWTSTDKHKVVHNIKNPVEQARSAKHAILDKLRVSGKWTRKWITLRHGVIFPDAATPPSSLGADKPSWLFCASYRLRHDITGWIDERLLERGDEANGRESLGRDGISALEHLFAAPFTLNFRISSTISEDIQSLDVLEPQQYLVLDCISALPRTRIEGAAGTGKTVLAMEAASRSGIDGGRTLLTCYNAPLAAELQRRLGDVPNVTVASFHSLCRSMAQEAGLSATPAADDRSYFENDLPELLVKALETKGELRFDHIVVDEGQDFLDNWWIALEEALIDGGTLRVFLDSNQRLYDRHSDIVHALELAPIPLNRNLRNTQRIHQASIPHYSGPDTTADGPQGMELHWVEIETASKLARAAFDEVRRLVYREELDPADVAVLVQDGDTLDSFMINTAHSSLSFADAGNLSSEAVVVDTVRRFKGLERAVVVLCIPEVGTLLTELAYTGITRARAALSIVCQTKDRPWIENGWRSPETLR